MCIRDRPEIIGDIVFDHVSFNYEDSEEHTLNDVSFHIEANTRVAIMGPTGSGKSSLIHLLNGIYDYKGGSIRIDGHELRTISKAWLRKKVQIVLQEPFLYSKMCIRDSSCIVTNTITGIKIRIIQNLTALKLILPSIVTVLRDRLS